MRSVFGPDWRRPDGPVASLRPDHELLLAEISPIRHSFLPAPFPLFLSQHSKLFHHLLRLHLLSLLVVGGLLELCDVILLLLEFLEQLQTVLLVLFLISGIWEQELSVFFTSCVLFHTLEFRLVLRLLHDS